MQFEAASVLILQVQIQLFQEKVPAAQIIAGQAFFISYFAHIFFVPYFTLFHIFLCLLFRTAEKVVDISTRW